MLQILWMLSFTLSTLSPLCNHQMFIMLKKDKYRKPETSVWDLMAAEHNGGTLARLS